MNTAALTACEHQWSDLLVFVTQSNEKTEGGLGEVSSVSPLPKPPAVLSIRLRDKTRLPQKRGPLD